ncbi:MAG TPA: response regulator [Pseudolabrys sp.]|jgi:two-component sensor histidine kinase|nr:response regulator [Pseudolabrys sp.]
MPRNVLYIDDDAGLRKLVERGLAREGVRVVCAASGEEGIKALAAEEFDAIALDHYMPGLDGLETLQRIHVMENHPPVIFVTGAQESRIAIAALKAGAFDYVIKDVQGEFIPLLFAAIKTAVQAMRMRRDKEAAEQEVREARDRFEALATERAILMREVNHRVGNSLQLIASLLTLQGNAARTPEVKTALLDATGRVHAVAQLHRRLYTSDDVQQVAVDQYLSGLLEDLRRSADSDRAARVTLDADPVDIHTDGAVAVGVIVNELVMNAIKYAYPKHAGAIRVTLKKTDPESALVCVEDDGIGFNETDNPTSTGLGQRIVKAMASKINGVITHEQKAPGTRMSVAFSLAGRKTTAVQHAPAS